MLTAKVDISGLKRRLATANARAPLARAEVVRQAGSAMLRAAYVYASPHIDTGRFRNSIAMAANFLEPGVLPISPLRRGRMADAALGRLERRRREQVAIVRKWEVIAQDTEREVAGFGSARSESQRRWRQTRREAAKKSRAIERKARKVLERIDESIAAAKGNPTAAVIFGNEKKGPLRLTSVTRVLGRVYGGQSRIVHTPDSTLLEVRLREPHSRIVERRYRIMARARPVALGLGLARAKLVYVKRSAA